MSRRKQAKPQQLRAEEGEEEEEQPQQQQEEEEEEEEAQRGADTPAHGLGHDAMEGEEREEPNENTSGSEETHVCDRCCAEFFSWAELSQHRRLCSHHQLVLIVKDAEGAPAAGSPPTAPPPEPEPPRPPSAATSDSSAVESASGGFEALGNEESPEEAEEAMETEGEKLAPSSSPPPPTAAGGYAIPSTNVTLEILHSTRVAVAQFSQGLSGGGGGGGGGRAASAAAIPLILEHLLALQQQQVQQLQLIEQICSQVAVINRQPTQAALNPAPRSLPPPPPATAAPPPPILPLSGTMPSNINGQAAAPYEKPHALPPHSSQSAFRDVPGGGGGVAPVSALLPPYAGPRPGSRSPTLSSGSPLSLGQSTLLGPSSSSSSSSSSLPFLPQSPPSGVIFPNPLASIAATANALDPLAALVKHRKGKLSLFAAEAKPGPEEPFFKHKCRFCAKVFGSDSALQIHLRSHTGERPFKCNICGNRFSTKGNLKVHFQRHKEKYPHVQMNPYPVPEYLDNVPTSSGIPYGMSVPPEKPVSSWLDSKPVVAALPASLGLPLSSTITSPAVSNDPVSVTPSLKSPHQPAPGECASLSPEQRGSEAHFSPVSESPQSNRETDGSGALKTEVIHLPQNCTLRLRASLEASGTAAAAAAAAGPSLAATPEPSPSPASASASPPLSSHSLEDAKVPACGPLDSMQTSETSKLQQLVENIDKKITDPNQCVLCHRVLSCQSALKMHYRIHTGERPFRCKVCGRAFTTKGNLKTHVGVHRENPPVHVQHSCPICQKKFTNAVVLQQHIRMHMVGRIPDSEADAGDRSLDALSCNDSDFMENVSMEEENAEEGDDTENMEEESPLKPLDSACRSPLKTGLSHLAILENQMRLLDSAASLHRSLSSTSLTNGFSDAAKCSPSEKKAESSTSNSSSGSPPGAASPLLGTLEGQITKSPSAENRLESQDPLAASVKREEVESPSSAPAVAAGGELRGKLCVKEESPYSFQMRDRGPSLPRLVPSTLPLVKTESLSHSQSINPSEGLPLPPPPPPFAVHVPPAYPAAVGGPGMALLGPAPPRRTPKQHNCNVCGKNFSSASALQIHERTHTGEKPFVCSICGRAFTTKGNLKVHMGTHMWNNAPARRGRRLSVENPMALLGGEAAKLGHMFQKDLAARAMNVDAGFWSRYATAITNSLAIKSNEISVIQNRGITPLHPIGAGVERLGAAAGALTKSAMELGGSRHFSMLIDDSKEIGIN